MKIERCMNRYFIILIKINATSYHYHTYLLLPIEKDYLITNYKLI